MYAKETGIIAGETFVDINRVMLLRASWGSLSNRTANG